METYFRVGVITAPHGVRGEVRVYPTTDEPRRFLDLKEIRLDGRQSGMRAIENVKFHKNMVILKLEGIDSANEAELYRDCDLLIDRKDALPLAENEYYIADLIGLSVETEEGEVLGTLTDVMRTGANDVYVVRSEQKEEILIPVIPDSRIRTDLAAGKMTVNLLPGLR